MKYFDMSKDTLTDLKARQIIDSRGNPTLEVEAHLVDGSVGIASVPSGASTGKYEAHELRDGKEEYDGKSVHAAVNSVNDIRNWLMHQGMAGALSHRVTDQQLIRLDGTANKKRYGANAILGVSLAIAKACAASKYKDEFAKSGNVPFYKYIGELSGNSSFTLPVPMVNIWNGGDHAEWATDIQEYMIIPVGSKTFSQGLEWCIKIYHKLGKMLRDAGYAKTVGDEGGYAPLNIYTNEEPLKWIMDAIEKRGFSPGSEVAIAIDAAASEFYDEGSKKYRFMIKANKQKKRKLITQNDLIGYYKSLKEHYPIVSIEDGLAQDDWDGWVKLTNAFGKDTQIVGDDLYVTKMERFKKGVELKASNAILIKPNQIGTLTETIDVTKYALQKGYGAVVSHRSGETEDTTIAHLAVGMSTGQIKAGSVARTDRVCKYNELLRIEEALGGNVSYGWKPLGKA